MSEEWKSRSAERVNALMEMRDFYDDVRAMAVAERQKLEAEGFSPTAAEQMAQTIWMSVVCPGLLGVGGDS